MSVSKQTLINYGYARGIVISMLFLSASGILGHQDHTILRFAVCGVSLWGVYYAKELKNALFLVLLAAVAAVFNPVWHPHGLSRGVWVGMDLAAVAVLAASIVGLSSRAPAGVAP